MEILCRKSICSLIQGQLLSMFSLISALKTVIVKISIRLEVPLFSSKARLKLLTMQAQIELSTAMDLDTLTATSIKRQSAFLQTTVNHASVASKFLRVTKQMELTKTDLLESSDLLQRVLRSNCKHSLSKSNRSIDSVKQTNLIPCSVFT